MKVKLKEYHYHNQASALAINYACLYKNAALLKEEGEQHFLGET